MCQQGPQDLEGVAAIAYFFFLSFFFFLHKDMTSTVFLLLFKVPVGSQLCVINAHKITRVKPLFHPAPHPKSHRWESAVCHQCSQDHKGEATTPPRTPPQKSSLGVSCTITTRTRPLPPTHSPSRSQPEILSYGLF